MKSLPNVYRQKELLDFEALEGQAPLNDNFEFTGYESGSFFILQELKFVLLIYYLGFLIPIIVISVFLTLNPRCAGCRRRFTRFYNFDFWIRLLLELFLDIALTTLIAMHSVFFNIS